MSRKIALGGVFAALAVALMLLGGTVPVAVYVCPMLASMLLVPLLPRLGVRLSLCWYAAVALLSLLLCPDRECSTLFLMLGYYPILRPRLQQLPKPVRLLLKLLLFFGAITVMYAVLLLVLRLPALLAEAAELTVLMGFLLAVLGTAAFLLYDLFLGRLDGRLQR